MDKAELIRLIQDDADVKRAIADAIRTDRYITDAIMDHVERAARFGPLGKMVKGR